MRILTCIALLILFFSTGCKKDNDDNENNNNNNNNNSGTLLRSFKYTIEDDSIRFNYTYNSQNRISGTEIFDYESGVLTEKCLLTYNYDGNDSLPVSMKIVYIYLTGGYPSDTGTEYFIKNNSGVLQKDSIKTESGFLRYNFAYAADYFTVTTSFFDTVIARQTLQNGNVVSEQDTVYGPSITDYSVNYIQAFDNHPNPFYYTGIRRTLLYMPENYIQDLESLTPVFKNNPTEIYWKATGSPGYTFHYQYSYTYGPNGLPLTVTANDLEGGDLYNGTFYY